MNTDVKKRTTYHALAMGGVSGPMTTTVALRQAWLSCRHMKIRNTNLLHGLNPSFRWAAQRGFTLIELIVIIMVLGVLIMLAAPSFQPLFERWRIREGVEAMRSSFYLARSEAIKRGGRVYMRKRGVDAGCAHANTLQNWGCGWTIYHDANNNRNMDADEIIQVVQAPSNLDIMNKPGKSMQIAFDRWGQPDGVGAVSFTFNYYKPGGGLSAAVTTVCVSSGGRLRVLQGDVSCS